MSDAIPECTLGMILAELGAKASLIGSNEAWLNRPVASATIWLPGAPLPTKDDVLVVCPDPMLSQAALEPLLQTGGPRLVAVAGSPSAEIFEYLVSQSRLHAVVVLDAPSTAAEVISVVAQASLTTEESVSRRLASLQRTLSQALSDPVPVEGIMARLKRVCNATIVLMDRNGEALYATGPVPLSLLFGEIAKTEADSQILDIDGWHGVATRLVDSDADAEHLGWLVAAARRTSFPDPYAISAVHIGATLIEVHRRMTVVSRSQERAVRATVLEQALALRPDRHDAEIAGRMAVLGLSFSEELRAVAIRPLRSVSKSREAEALQSLADTVTSVLTSASMPSLYTVRERAVVLIVQGRLTDTSRLLSSHKRLGNMHVGIGRQISVVADVADSYHDAQLAVRTLRQTSRGPATMSYEELDLATALFSDVGLDKMAQRAQSYLAPLADRESLVEGLRTYFDHGLNIIAAADELSIHHNSLRYRLSKVESLLEIDLKEAGDIASVFLALTALELNGKLPLRQARLPGKSGPGRPTGVDVAASGAATDYVGEPIGLGVVLGGGD